MTPDERLVQAIESLREEDPNERLAKAISNLRTEDPNVVFDAMHAIIEDLGFGWVLERRDPGPLDCELDTGWCYTHNAWMDEHEWHNAALSAELHPSNPEGWFKAAGIVDEDEEMGTVSEITDSYRRLAQVRRTPEAR